ncbi:hypothetical protein ACS0TY_014835 [Phlomoides rotata]
MVGSLGNLYESIEALDESYIQPNISKDTLLKPAASLPDFSVPLLSFKKAPQASSDKEFYRCPNASRDQYCDYTGRYRSACSADYGYVTDNPRATCPKCGIAMNTMVTYVAPPGVAKQAAAVGGGFVKEVVTYMVMDDLVVKPMSTISSITLLSQFNINNVAALEEKVVDLGMNEVSVIKYLL